MNNLFKKKRTIYQLAITACIIYFHIHSAFFASATTLGDNYPYTAINAVDPWRLYTRQCTSFSAFRLSTVNGFTLPPAYGDANVWGHRAISGGYDTCCRSYSLVGIAHACCLGVGSIWRHCRNRRV